jgi:hypothetical protein
VDSQPLPGSDQQFAGPEENCLPCPDDESALGSQSHSSNHSAYPGLPAMPGQDAAIVSRGTLSLSVPGVRIVAEHFQEFRECGRCTLNPLLNMGATRRPVSPADMHPAGAVANPNVRPAFTDRQTTRSTSWKRVDFLRRKAEAGVGHTASRPLFYRPGRRRPRMIGRRPVWSWQGSRPPSYQTFELTWRPHWITNAGKPHNRGDYWSQAARKAPNHATPGSDESPS